MNAYGNITKALEKIQNAATPTRFTQDFLAAKLGLKGGSARPVIPFLKRTGFIGSDGVPTELYKRFRNSSQRGPAAAEAIKKGFSSLYEVNEYAHDISDKELLDVIVQATGLAADNNVIKSILGSFKALKAYAVFDGVDEEEEPNEELDEETKEEKPDPRVRERAPLHAHGLGLSYTINLNLPATSDIAVFDAIFKSLKEHILK